MGAVLCTHTNTALYLDKLGFIEVRNVVESSGGGCFVLNCRSRTFGKKNRGYLYSLRVQLASRFVLLIKLYNPVKLRRIIVYEVKVVNLISENIFY